MADPSPGPGATPLALALARRAWEDGEFRLAARYWEGSLRLDPLGELLEFAVSAEALTPAAAGAEGARHIGIRAPREVWQALLAPVPPPFFNDIMPARAFGLTLEGEAETFWQYYPAVRRLVDLLREEVNGAAVR